MKNNDNGFIHIILISMLPLMIGLCLFAFSFIAVSQTNTSMMSECRAQQINTQQKVKLLLEKLLSKNDSARILKIQFIAAQAKLAAAISSGHPAAIALATKQLEAINFKRQSLDLLQKEIQAQAKLILIKDSWKNFNQVQHLLTKQKNITHLFLNLNGQLNFPVIPNLAVEPEIPDLAPPYRTQLNFSKLQAVTQKWQYRVSMIPQLQKFLKGDISFEKQCSTTLQKKDYKWIITTIEDKF